MKKDSKRTKTSPREALSLVPMGPGRSLDPHPTNSQLLKLNIGSGTHGRQKGWHNCDLTPGPNVDTVFSADSDTWPYKDNSISEVYCCHVLEHLRNPFHFFREAYRVLIPNGNLLIRVPYGGHHAAWWDLTHVQPYFPETFCFVQPGYERSVGNPQHQMPKYAFGVQIVQMRVSMRLAKMLRRWWWRWAFGSYSMFFDREIEEVWAHLFALKGDEDIQHYMKDHPANVVPAEFCAWKHHLNPKWPSPTDDQPAIMCGLGTGVAVNGFISKVLKG